MTKAIAVLRGDSPVSGIVTFEQPSEKEDIKITVDLKGMEVIKIT